MKKIFGPGKPKAMMKDMKPAMKTEKKLALKKEVKPMPAQMASKKTEVIKSKGIAKASSISKPKPIGKKVDTGKMVERSIKAGKEMKAAKRANRKETAAMVLGGLAATAGTLLAGGKGQKKFNLKYK